MSTDTGDARSQTTSDWQVTRSRLGPLVTLLLHVTCIGLLTALTYPGRHLFVWVGVILYFWFFYYYIARHATWTNETLAFINRSLASQPLMNLQNLLPRDDWPSFVLIVPAWGSGRCIALTAAILNRIRYPRNLWKVILVSDEDEHKSLQARSHVIAEDIYHVLAHGGTPTLASVRHAALLLYIVDDGRAPLTHYVHLFGIKGRKSNRILQGLIGDIVQHDLRSSHDQHEETRDQLMRLTRAKTEHWRRILGHISRALEIHTSFLLELENLDSWLAPSLPRATIRSICSDLPLSPSSARLDALRLRLLRPENQELWARAHQQVNPSTTTAINACLSQLNATNFHHLIRPPGVRNKASALNFAFDSLESLGWLRDDTQIMVLDSDSLLHSHALSSAALDIAQHDEANVIRQLLPITTTNFSGRNWMVQTIIAADSIAAAGRWARNVRMRLRSDLTAGSGVIIPVSLLRYLKRTYADPWDPHIICEDARMIISQYAILDGATKKTRMIPAYVLEGAPEQESVWGTYLAFWNQRLRWAIGGMHESQALLNVTLPQMLVNSSDLSSRSANTYEKLVSMYRKFRLFGEWTLEHLRWSGIAFAPFVWSIGEIICGSPSWTVRGIALLILFAFPATLLRYTFAPHVAPLIPGGASAFQMARLVPLLAIMGTPYALPVVAAQLLCLTGASKHLPAAWNPVTPKPGSRRDSGMPSKQQ